MGNLADSILIGLLFAPAPYTELLRLYDYDRNAPLEIQEARVEVRGLSWSVGMIFAWM